MRIFLGGPGLPESRETAIITHEGNERNRIESRPSRKAANILPTEQKKEKEFLKTQ